MELKDYLRILMFSCALFGIAGAVGASIATTCKYVANTELYVSVQAVTGAAAGDLVQGMSFARRAVATYVHVVNSATLLNKVIKAVKELKLDVTAAATRSISILPSSSCPQSMRSTRCLAEPPSSLSISACRVW